MVLFEGIYPLDESLLAFTRDNENVTGFSWQLCAVPVLEPVCEVKRPIKGRERLEASLLAPERAGAALWHKQLDEVLFFLPRSKISDCLK
jgi:hypothetical protein